MEVGFWRQKLRLLLRWDAISIRLPFCRWSTSTLSETSVAVTTTSLLLPGLTEIAPYCVSTETFALGPTVKRYSFLVSAKATVARQVARTRVTTVVFRNFAC